MGTLQVKVNPTNPGDITVRVKLSSHPGGTALDETFTVTSTSPLDQTWDNLDPALYSVFLSWTSGYHNISGSTEGNGIIVNGIPKYYQVLGNPAAGTSDISATVGCRIR